MKSRSLVLFSVLAILASTLACSISTSPAPATATVAPSVLATVTPTSAPLTGTITGHLSYPSEFIPPMKVVAFDVVNPSNFYFVTTEMNQSEYTLQAPAGTYYVVSYVLESGGTPGLAGGYSKAVPCGLQVGCDDHSLIPVTVAAGQTVTGIDPGDWYAPEGTFPAMP
jgi:hypothetical protein